jgi:hypothetical protein
MLLAIAAEEAQALGAGLGGKHGHLGSHPRHHDASQPHFCCCCCSCASCRGAGTCCGAARHGDASVCQPSKRWCHVSKSQLLWPQCSSHLGGSLPEKRQRRLSLLASGGKRAACCHRCCWAGWRRTKGLQQLLLQAPQAWQLLLVEASLMRRFWRGCLCRLQLLLQAQQDWGHGCQVII